MEYSVSVIKQFPGGGLMKKKQVERLSDEHLEKVFGLFETSKGAKNDEEE